MPDNLLFRLQTKIFSRLYIDLNSRYQNSVLLSSLGRSGSTLVSDIINYNNNYRVIFEPFKHDIVKAARPFVYPSFIPLNIKNYEHSKAVDRVLTGNISGAWVDKDNRKVIASKRLIKDIRTNLMLGWIRNNYPDLPIVLLVRNPFATIESWMRAKWPADIPKKRILEQADLLSPILPEGILETYAAADTALKNHLFNWCINYYIPLLNAEKNNIHVTVYENYITNPDVEIKKLFDYLNIPFNNKVLHVSNKLSRTTRSDSPLKSGDNILTAWRKKFTETEIADGIKILSLFGFDALYDYDTGLPKEIFTT